MNMSQWEQRPPHVPNVLPSAKIDAPGATAGLVFGILSIVISWPIIGLIFGFIGLSKSKQAKELCQSQPEVYCNEGLAQAGYICSIIGICLGGLSTLCGCGYFAFIIAMIAGGAGGSSSGW